MRELLLAFIVALILGSIINGMQLQQAAAPGVKPSAPAADLASGPRRDFPDFASFLALDSTNFESQVLKSTKPVFIDCYVPNNAGCDQMLPLVAAVAKGHTGTVVMAKMNLMDNIVLAHRYELSSVPMFLLFDKGELVSKLAGIVPQERLESMITNLQQSVSSFK